MSHKTKSIETKSLRWLRNPFRLFIVLFAFLKEFIRDKRIRQLIENYSYEEKLSLKK